MVNPSTVRQAWSEIGDRLAFIVVVTVPFRLMPNWLELALLPYAGRYAYAPDRIEPEARETAVAPPPTGDSHV